MLWLYLIPQLAKNGFFWKSDPNKGNCLMEIVEIGGKLKTGKSILVNQFSWNLYNLKALSRTMSP